MNEWIGGIARAVGIEVGDQPQLASDATINHNKQNILDVNAILELLEVESTVKCIQGSPSS